MGPPRQYIYPNIAAPVGPIFFIEQQICLLTRRAEPCQSLFSFRSIPLLTPANLPPLESQPIKHAFVFRGLLSAGTFRLSALNVCEREAAVYCTVPVHSGAGGGGALRNFGSFSSFIHDEWENSFLIFILSLPEASQGPCRTIPLLSVLL